MAGGESVGNAYLNVIPRVEGDAKSLGNKFGNDLSGGAKSTLSAGAVALGNILSNVITSVASTAGEQLSKAFWNYADYEQLVGGVETLFKDASQTVQENAKNAFRTAGMSANEYMENVTSFSASLIQSLDGDTSKAAKVADKAITDMSDNANKMGTDIGRITDAYQGFAKQNYTMLDNLKLGYGGTKSEMERLLADASKIAGVEFNIDSYSDVIEAIHVMQTEMGITGTTMEEGSKTISGSINQLKGAWDNFLTAIGDGGRTMDLSKVTQDLINSLGDLASNVIPAIMRIGSAIALQLPKIIGDAMMGLVPVVREGLVNAFGEDAGVAFDSFAETVGRVRDIVVDVMGVIQNIIVQAMPVIQAAIVPVLTLIANAVTTAVNTILPIVESVVTFLKSNVQPVVSEVFGAIQNTIVPIIEEITSLVQSALPTVQSVFDTVMHAVQNVVSTVWPAIKDLISSSLSAIQSIVQTVWPYIRDITTNVFNAVRSVANAVWPVVSSIVSTAANVIKSAINGLNAIVNGVKNTFNSIKQAITNPIETAKDAISKVVDKIKNIFNNLKITIPKPKVPKVTVDGGEAPWGIGGKGRLPSFHVDWARLGGFVSDPTLLGAGEAYTEMVLPKRGGLMNDFADAVTEHVGNDLVVAELQTLRKSLGGIIATYAPTATPREIHRINQKVNAYV